MLPDNVLSLCWSDQRISARPGVPTKSPNHPTSFRSKNNGGRVSLRFMAAATAFLHHSRHYMFALPPPLHTTKQTLLNYEPRRKTSHTSAYASRHNHQPHKHTHTPGLCTTEAMCVENEKLHGFRLRKARARSRTITFASATSHSVPNAAWSSTSNRKSGHAWGQEPHRLGGSLGPETTL